MKERKKEREGDGQTDREEEEKKVQQKKRGRRTNRQRKKVQQKKKKKRGRRTDQRRRRRKKGKKKKQLFHDATPTSSSSFSFSPSFLFSFLINETFRVSAWYPFTGQNSQISPIHYRYSQYFFQYETRGLSVPVHLSVQYIPADTV